MACSWTKPRAQWVPRLVLAHWWVELGPRVTGFRFLGVSKLVFADWLGGAGFWATVLRGPRCFGAVVGL